MEFARPSRLPRCALFLSLAAALVPVAATPAGAQPVRALAPAVAEVFTLDEAARFLRLKPQLVAQLARSQSLPGRHVGGQWRFHRAALVDWLQGDRFAQAQRSATTALVAPAPAAPAPALSSNRSERSTAAAAAPQLVRVAATAETGAADNPAAPERGSATAAQVVGEKPTERRAEETALRDQGVLLPAGRTTLETGLTYARAERQNVGLLRVVQSSAAANLALRYGIRDDLQLSMRLPVTHRRVSIDVAPTLGDSSRTSETYAGDLSTSLLGVLSRERTGRPNVVVSGDLVLPTGSGDRGVGAGIVLSKSFDPVVLFGGASYMHGFHVADSDRRRVLATHNVGFNFGYAYAVNDSVALSGAFIGSYRTTSRAFTNGGLPPSREGYQLQLGATMQIGRGLFVEPAVAIGIGGSGPDLTLMLNLPYTF